MARWDRLGLLVRLVLTVHLDPMGPMRLKVRLVPMPPTGRWRRLHHLGRWVRLGLLVRPAPMVPRVPRVQANRSGQTVPRHLRLLHLTVPTVQQVRLVPLLLPRLRLQWAPMDLTGHSPTGQRVPMAPSHHLDLTGLLVRWGRLGLLAPMVPTVLRLRSNRFSWCAHQRGGQRDGSRRSNRLNHSDSESVSCCKCNVGID